MSQRRKAADLELLDVESFIEQKEVAKVSSPIVLNGKELNEDGLFSTVIFGDIGSDERLQKFGYIDLNTEVLQPFVFNLLMKMNSTLFINILNQNTKYRLVDGSLEETEEEFGLTGIELLKTYWKESINFLGKTKSKTETTESRAKNIKTLLLLKPDEVFTSKWIVAPAGIREINTMDLEEKGIVNYHEINDFYLDILRIASNIVPDNPDPNLVLKLHSSLFDLHQWIMENLSGKKGLIFSKSLKKPISFASRSVIVAPNISSTEKWNENTSNNIQLGDIGISVKMLCSIFFPFVVNGFSNYYKEASNSELDTFIESHVEGFDKINKIEVIKQFIDNFTADESILKKEAITIQSNGSDKKLYFVDWVRHFILYPIVGRDEPIRYVSVTRFPYNNLYSNQFLKAVPYTTSNISLIPEDSTGEEIEITNDINNISDGFALSTLSYEGFGADK